MFSVSSVKPEKARADTEFRTPAKLGEPNKALLQYIKRYHDIKKILITNLPIFEKN
jgi:hypothetical protein